MDEVSPKASVELGIDTSAFEEGLEDAARSAEEFGEGLEETLDGAAEASASEWESAMDRAAQTAQRLAAKVDGVFKKVNDSITGLQAKVAGELEATAGMDSEKIGERWGSRAGTAMGASIGGLLGSWLPGVGTAIGASIGGFVGDALGEELGGALGKEISFDGLRNQFDELLNEQLPNFVAGWQYAWDSTKEDAEDTFNEIKDVIRNSGIYNAIKDALHGGSWEEVLGKFEAAWDNIGQKVDDFRDRSIFRLWKAIDDGFNKIREPLARMADWVQKQLADWGILTQQTESWGESIRNAANVGLEAMKALAYAFGFLEGVIKKVLGYYLEFLSNAHLALLAEALKAVATGLAEAIAMILEVPGVREILGMRGIVIDAEQLKAAAAGFADRIDKGLEAVKAKAEELKAVDPLELARRRRDEMPGLIERGRELEKIRVDNLFVGPPEPPKEAVPEVQAENWTFGAAQFGKAILEGSAEAAKLIQRAQFGGTNRTQWDILGDEQRKQVIEAQKGNAILVDIKQALKNAQVVKPK